MKMINVTAASLPASRILQLAAGLGLFSLALFAGLPAKAANFTPPDGCTLNLTVQNHSCTVTQYFTCSTDPKGDQRSATFAQDGLRYLSRIDAETRWLESSSPPSGIHDVLVEDAADHASFSTLEETGFDDFDFWTQSNSGEKLRHVGNDKLTGRKVTIDDVELEETRFQLKTYNEAGDLLIDRKGQQYINREMGRFFGGKETMNDWTGAKSESDDSPVLFRFPGDTGFGSTTPQFDCGMQMVGLPHSGDAL